MTALGLVIFAISVVVVSMLGEGVLDPMTLEPGLGLSAQALGLAFALAGALASTVVAYSALKAQNSAVNAQRSAEIARDDAARRESLERRSVQLRHDIQRHAELSDATRAVFTAAETVVEFVSEDIRRLLSVPLDHKGDLPAFDVYRCTGPLITAHKHFWENLHRACETNSRDLSLDALWLQRSEEHPLHLERLSAAVGLFGMGGARGHSVTPSTLSVLGTPMTPVVASNLMTIIWAVACDQAAEKMAEEMGELTDEVTRGPNHVQKRVDADLADARGVIDQVLDSQGKVMALSAQANAVMQEIETLSGSLAPDTVPTSLVERLTAADVALDRLVRDATDLRRYLPDPSQAALELDMVERQLDEVLDEVRETVTRMTERLRESNAEMGARVAEALMVARHSPNPNRSDPLAELAVLVAGAIVFPDGTLLRVQDAEGWYWKLNPGLSLIEDLTAIYQDRCDAGAGRPDGVLDLARLLPDSAQLGTAFGTETYGTLREKYVGQIPVAQDAIWRHLRERRAALLDALMHKVSTGPYRPGSGSEEDHKLIFGLLSGNTMSGATLQLEPVPAPATTAENAHAEALGAVERPPW
ncbi:hypothetical protein GCM10016455_14680 [Aliiroseovarius zhejiangensis]|uniref:Uncharacterized protein n=2 Tax=Aliiroseovarius zhejiangensis TaxID=1632025 RepID=A0ABQ3J049_9RHOB|nr:hypothetical protein GCM10016455_14680 [Aliiroseovarius zhejiangensis]